MSPAPQQQCGTWESGAHCCVRTSTTNYQTTSTTNYQTTSTTNYQTTSTTNYQLSDH